jgi:hypothetical protein
MRSQKSLLAMALVAVAFALASCTSSSVGNTIAGAAGGKAEARLVDASPAEPGPLSLLVASTSINSGITTATPVGVYETVGAGTQQFQISPTSVAPVSKSVAASTFYTVVLLGEPGQPDFGEDIFQDTNSIQSASSVRYKVNDAAPLPGPIDVYVYQGGSLPTTPSVTGLTVGNDSGSIANPPGNSYVPTMGSATILPSGVYNVTVTAAGQPTTVLFTGSADLSVNHSYSLTIEDNASPSSANVILAVDQPAQATNQSSLMTDARHPR